MVKISSQEEFESEVIDTGERVLVDFYANWCGPCRQMEPVLEDLSEDMNIKKVDIDSVPEVAEDYGVMALPTLAVFEEGEEKDRRTGFADEGKIRDFYND